MLLTTGFIFGRFFEYGVGKRWCASFVFNIGDPFLED